MSTPGSPDPRESAAPCLPPSVEPDPWTPGLPSPLTKSPLLTQHLLCLRPGRKHGPTARRKREMTPLERKDEVYWNKRKKNNDAAKRSREKRRLKDLMLEGRLLALSHENAQLRAQLLHLRCYSSLRAEKCSASSVEPATFLAGRQQGSFSSPHRGFDPYQGLLPPLRALLEAGGAPEAHVDAQPRVSASDDIPNASHLASPLPVRLPTRDAFQHGPIFSYPAPGWPVPHVSPPPLAYHDILLPWRCPHLDSSAVYPGLPPHMLERHDQGVGVGADLPR